MKRLLTVLALVLALVLAVALLPLSAFAQDEYEFVVNPNLELWSQYYQALHLNMLADGEALSDSILPGARILYMENNVRRGSGGERVIDGGMTSEHGTFTIGMGAGVDDDALWYLSFSYNANADLDVIMYNTLFTLIALEAAELMPELDTEYLTIVAQAMINSDEDIAMEVGDLVLAGKWLGSGQRLVLVNSLPFYDAFYLGTIENYISLND